jgi:L-aminopeptidase/D-esterase-like protein
MRSIEFLFNDQMNLLFKATIQCVEEAVINAMVAAEIVIGHNGLSVEAILHENLMKIFKKYNRLNDT